MDEFLETVNYRDLSIPVYKSTNSDIYMILAGKQIKLNCNLENYRNFIMTELDRMIDQLERFTISDNCYLEYFNNAGHFDLRLVLYGRIIKIFLVKDNYLLSEETINKLIEDCRKIILEIA